jgi:putative mRNA 3-end processing factor
LKVKVLGAAKKVGCSGFLLTSSGQSLLLDYGIETNREMIYPLHVRPKEISALLTTHSHLDHIGAEPLLYIDKNIKHYATKPTIQVSEVLLNDLLKISGSKLPFTQSEVRSLIDNSNAVRYNEPFKVGDFRVTFLDAGHIPGSAMIYIEEGDKKVLYTGDMNHLDTRLVRPAVKEISGDLDLVITESTYAHGDHKDRLDEERKFIEYSREIVEGGGTLLVPAFAVSRAQEIAEIYYELEFNDEIYMDGMALKINEIYLNNPDFIRDPEMLRSSLSKITFIKDWRDRRKIVKRKASIISPAGMLSGGASTFYNERISGDDKNGIAIVSYQVEGTPGREMLDNRMIWIRGRRAKIKARLEQFEFSSHSGRTQLLDFFKGISGSPRVLTIHGEPESCAGLANDLNGMGMKAVAPSLGDEVEI